MSKQPCLDHVVLLLPYEQLQNLPAWVTNNFTISDGGERSKCILEENAGRVRSDRLTYRQARRRQDGEQTRPVPRWLLPGTHRLRQRRPGEAKGALVVSLHIPRTPDREMSF